MKMRNKSWAVLVAAAVILGGAGWWVAVSRDQAAQADFTPKPLFPGLTAKVNDVMGLEISTAKTMFRIERGATADHWTMPSRQDYPVRADLVRKNVLGIAGLETIEPRSDKPAHYNLLQVSEPDQYQPVDDAAKSDPGPILVRLADKDAKAIAAVIIGKTRSYPAGGKPGQLQVRKPDEARAWLAQGTLELPADPVQWLVKDLIKIDKTRVAHATVKHPDGEVLRVVRGPEKADGAPVDFVPSEMPKGMKIGSPFDVNAVAGGLAYLGFEDVAKAAEHDFARATVTEIVTLDGVKAVVRTIPAADHDKKFWLTISASFDPALVKPDAARDLLKPEEAEKQVKEAMARIDGWAYLVNDYAARDLTRRLKDLIEPEKKDEPRKG
ncbi:MAG: DUF4340 domain-containing protein [Ferrovibrio sp.]|uniref:DUF4340 domain-containing protein n=1 Tax=Ferrovibrio sp. TaxID=1917215 RepID=UPI002635304A|nr:DUF4340 domain-containing protein [Ferrovibrio sp.]MCW0236243.1 DUF4340 domain-containing protein [Ferrovibrio sp.]